MEQQAVNTARTTALREKLSEAGVLNADYLIYKQGGLEKFNFDKDGNSVGFVATEADRARRKGPGTDYLINRRTSILHPHGVSFINASALKTEGASRSELADASNWKSVYEPKQIRMVAFKHKLG